MGLTPDSIEGLGSGPGPVWISTIARSVASGRMEGQSHAVIEEHMNTRSISFRWGAKDVATNAAKKCFVTLRAPGKNQHDALF